VHNHGSPFNAMSPAIVQPDLAGLTDKERLCEVYCFCKEKGKSLCANMSLATPRYSPSPRKLGIGTFPFPLRYWDPYDPKFYVEVPFDMTAPGGPAPMMDPTQRMSKPPHHPLPQAVQWGMTGSRRPDGVIVHNPALPLTRQNIKAIFEFKFPGDRFRNNGQLKDYEKIARGKGFVVLDEKECGASCPKEEPERTPVRERVREKQPEVPPMFVPLGGRQEEEDKRRPVPIGPLIPVLSVAGLLALLARFGSVLNPAFMVPIMPGTFANPNAGKET